MKSNFYKYIPIIATSLCMLFIGNAGAGDATLNKRIDGIDIYMGITHADLADQDLSAQQMAMVHGLRGKKHHITVALFDGKTGQRITDAKVVARIGEMGLGSNRKKLKQEKYGDAVSYGRDFYIDKEGPYWIDLKIKRNGVKQATLTRFKWEHF